MIGASTEMAGQRWNAPGLAPESEVPMQAKRTPTGIRVRHGRACASTNGRRCNCTPSYEASVYSARDGRKLRQTFPTLAAARAWRHDAAGAVRRGSLAATPTV